MLRNQKGKENGRKWKLVFRVGTCFSLKSWPTTSPGTLLENVMGEDILYWIQGLIFFFFFWKLRPQWIWARNRVRELSTYGALWTFFILLHFPQSPLWTRTKGFLIITWGWLWWEGKLDGNPLSCLPGINVGWEIMDLWAHKLWSCYQMWQPGIGL